MTLPRKTARVERNDRPPPRYCEDCGSPTRNNKPFCTDHVKRNDYASVVVRRISRRQRGYR